MKPLVVHQKCSEGIRRLLNNMSDFPAEIGSIIKSVLIHHAQHAWPLRGPQRSGSSSDSDSVPGTFTPTPHDNGRSATGP